MRDLDQVQFDTFAEPRDSPRAFLITDIRGYTRFTRDHGDAAAAELTRRFAELVEEAVEARGGRVVELRGDEAFAAFATARQALRSAIELQATLAEERDAHPDWPLVAGIGVDVGDVVPVGDGYRGAAINVAARLCAVAEGDQVLATEAASRLAGDDGVAFEPLGALELKGLDRPVPVVKVAAAGAERDAREAEAARGDLPAELDPASPLLAGRDRELAWLRGRWRLARRGTPQVALVLGPAGIGKTRLAAELAREVHADGARVLRASPLDGAFAQTLEQAAGTEIPCLMVAEDLQAAPPAGLAALEALAARAAPVLLLCSVIDEDAGSPVRAALDRLDPDGDARRRLTPLDADGVRLVAELYMGDRATPVPVAHVLEGTGGNPRAVHEAVSEWVRQEAARRLRATADRTASERGEARSAEQDLADRVVDLQLVRDRVQLYGAEAAGRHPATGARPFKGLEPFDQADSEWFSGRERLVADLIARSVGSPLVALVGASGAGKSSALRAGLLAALSAGVLPGSEDWRIALIRPGAHPLAALDAGVAAAGERETRLVVAVDQFEELFTQCTDEAERHAFADALLAHAAAGALVAVTIRADFYGECAAFPALAELLAAHHVLAGPMREQELRRAIELPARRAGLRLEPGVVDALVAEAIDEPGGLPLLSAALLELWQRRDGRVLRLATLRATGGVHGAVARLAEAAYHRLAPGQRALARPILLRLATLTPEGPVRRRVEVSELELDRDPDRAAVVSELADARLLTVSDRTVEVAHEALLREWPRLRDWLEADAQGRVVHDHLIVAAGTWEDRGRDPSELYRGARLAAALDWSAERGEELNERERAFLTASREAAAGEAARQRRVNRRLRALLAGAAVLLVAAAVAGAVALVQRSHARREAATAVAQKLGSQALVTDRIDRAMLLARAGVAIDDSVATRSNLLATLLRSPAAIGTMHAAPGNRLLALALSRDGRTLALGDNNGGLTFYDTRTRRALGPRRVLTAAVYGVHYSADGRTLAIDGPDRRSPGSALVLYDVATRRFRTVRPAIPGAVGDVSFSPDGRTLAVGWSRPGGTGGPGPGFVARYDVATAGRAGRPLALGNAQSVLPRYLPDGRLAVGDGKSTVRILDPGMHGVARTYHVPAFVFAPSPDGRKLAVGSEAGTVGFVDLRTGSFDRAAGRHDSTVQAIAYTPDGRRIVTAGDDSKVIVWDVAARQEEETFAGHAGRVLTEAISADGSTLYTGSLDGNVIVWDLAGTRRLGRPFTAGPGNPGLPWFSVSPDGRRVAVPDQTGAVAVLDATSLRRVARVQVMRGRPVGLTGLAPGGGPLLAGSQATPVFAYDVRTGRRVAALAVGRGATAEDLAFPPAGRTALVLTDRGTLLRFDLRTLRPAGRPVRVPRGGSTLAVDPTGTRAAVATDSQQLGGDGAVHVVDLRTGRQLGVLRRPAEDLAVVSWSPDGRYLATGDGAGETHLWDGRTFRLVPRPLQVHPGYVLSLSWSPDSRLLATSGTDGTTDVQDVASGALIGAPLPSSPLNHWLTARFSPDGRFLFAVSETGKAVRWDMRPAAWARHACQVAARRLTREEWRQYASGQPYRRVC